MTLLVLVQRKVPPGNRSMDGSRVEIRRGSLFRRSARMRSASRLVERCWPDRISSGCALFLSLSLSASVCLSLSFSLSAAGVVYVSVPLIVRWRPDRISIGYAARTRCASRHFQVEILGLKGWTSGRKVGRESVREVMANQV